MEKKLVECVPNFSEGKDRNIIDQIVAEIKAVDDVKLLDVDPGPEMNRTVVTFIGTPGGVKIAAFNAIKKAAELIDMSKHKGSHPRMGATDVCPFVPVSSVSVEECVELSKEVARRVAEELSIPVYLYEKSAQSPDRQNLAVIRQGEYEGLEEKLKLEKWKPDFGAAKFNARSGATVMGVREFLIAYNISLNTRDKLHATDIAFELREKGRSCRTGSDNVFYYKKPNILKYEKGHYPCGSDDFVGKTMDETIAHCSKEHGYDLAELLWAHGVNPQKAEGQSVKKPGKFKQCKAIGWYVPEYDRAQISINLTNYKETSMHDVLEEARRLAAERGLAVTGSEIVGLVPFDALLDSGTFYLRRQQRSVGIPVRDILNTAVQSLGLNDVSPFKLEERVLGMPDIKEGTLAAMTVHGFVDEVSRESPAPGGGSVAALAGAVGAALSSMVANLSSNTRGTEEADQPLNEAAELCQEIKQNLLHAIDADTDAFNAYMDARRMPQNSPEESDARNKAMQDGLKQAVAVPMNTARQSFRAIKVAETVIKYGNPASSSDVAVGAQMAFAGVKGGVFNVLINLKDIEDKAFVDEMEKRCKALESDSVTALQNVMESVKKLIQ